MKITDDNFEKVIFDLRKYYRKNFKNGGSDEAFLDWVELVLNIMYGG